VKAAGKKKNRGKPSLSVGIKENEKESVRCVKGLVLGRKMTCDRRGGEGVVPNACADESKLNMRFEDLLLFCPRKGSLHILTSNEVRPSGRAVGVRFLEKSLPGFWSGHRGGGRFIRKREKGGKLVAVPRGGHRSQVPSSRESRPQSLPTRPSWNGRFCGVFGRKHP